MYTTVRVIETWKRPSIFILQDDNGERSLWYQPTEQGSSLERMLKGDYSIPTFSHEKVWKIPTIIMKALLAEQAGALKQVRK